MQIKKEIIVEELIRKFPAAEKYLFERGIMCSDCKGVLTGTLEDAAKKMGFDPEAINTLVRDINKLLDQRL